MDKAAHSEEGLTSDTAVSSAPSLVAAALGDRGNSGELLKLIRACIAFTLLAEGSQQARSAHGSGSGEGSEQGVVRQSGSESSAHVLVEERGQTRWIASAAFSVHRAAKYSIADPNPFCAGSRCA
jgi:hypothetical protein